MSNINDNNINTGAKTIKVPMFRMDVNGAIHFPKGFSEQQRIKRNSTTSGDIVTDTTTEELANYVLAMPGTMFTFATSLEDMHHHKELNCDVPIDPWPWYGIVCAKMFDVYSVFINRLTIVGGAPFVFDLPDYDDNLDASLGEKQSEQCLANMINGLIRFNKAHSIYPDTWYLKDTYDDIKILFNGKE